MTLEFRQTNTDGGWHPWESVDGLGDMLDRAVALVIEAHEHAIGDEAVAVSVTAWDGTIIEYVVTPSDT